MINKLKTLLTKHDKKFLVYLLIFSIFISLLETVGISVIMPFISVASDFNNIHTNKYYEAIYNFLGCRNDVQFVLYFGLFIVLFYVFRAIVTLSYFYLLAKFSKGRYHTLARRLFGNYLKMSYRDFTEQNSSHLNKTIINEAQNLTQLIASVVFMLSEVFVVVFIYSMLLYVNWKITLILSLILTLNILFLLKVLSPKIKQAGIDRERHQREFFEIIGSTLGNFKIIKLRSNTESLMQKFSSASQGFAKTDIIKETLGHVPRLYLEMVGFSIVVIMVVYPVFRYETDVSSAMALISVFILGLYRLMPSANRILSSYNNILYTKRSLDIVHSEIFCDSEKLGEEEIVFKHKIELKDIYFEYIENKPILKAIDLTIHKGSSIAFVGESGSGKSTLVDIIIGLYRPIKGVIEVDNVTLNDTNLKSWRRKIGYIPQSVYLFDGTVAENVAFGGKIDREKVKKVLRQANILEFLEEHQEGIDTVVGEGGIKLSGGQKQRIAIARALYSDPEVLVLDEATSALDNETEAKIMDEIYEVSEGKTLIIIAHRLSTITRCEKVYTLENGELKE